MSNAGGQANAVVAKLHNKASYEEGFATASLSPGMGCMIDESGTDTTVSPAAANSPTTRIVREPRNPASTPTGTGGMDTSPLDATLPTDHHVETVGFQRFDEARCRVAGTSTAAVGDDVGWDSNGELSNVETDGTTALTTVVGRVQDLLTGVSPDFDVAVVEFY